MILELNKFTPIPDLNIIENEVCAQRFVLSPLKLYTSMKVTDSLDKKLPLFYAELQRLKMIMDAIAITNYHFDGYIEGDKLLSDYKLKTGICKSSNALELMKKVGIQV